MADGRTVVLEEVDSKYGLAFPEAYHCEIRLDNWRTTKCVHALIEPVDGHWLIVLEINKENKVIGMTSQRDMIGEKTYTKAREWGEEYASEKGAKFVDNTRRGKERALEADWDVALAKNVKM